MEDKLRVGVGVLPIDNLCDGEGAGPGIIALIGIHKGQGQLPFSGNGTPLGLHQGGKSRRLRGRFSRLRLIGRDGAVGRRRAAAVGTAVFVGIIVLRELLIFGNTAVTGIPIARDITAFRCVSISRGGALGRSLILGVGKAADSGKGTRHQEGLPGGVGLSAFLRSLVIRTGLGFAAIGGLLLVGCPVRRLRVLFRRRSGFIFPGAVGGLGIPAAFNIVRICGIFIAGRFPGTGLVAGTIIGKLGIAGGGGITGIRLVRLAALGVFGILLAGLLGGFAFAGLFFPVAGGFYHLGDGVGGAKREVRKSHFVSGFQGEFLGFRLPVRRCQFGFKVILRAVRSVPLHLLFHHQCAGGFLIIIDKGDYVLRAVVGDGSRSGIAVGGSAAGTGRKGRNKIVRAPALLLRHRPPGVLGKALDGDALAVPQRDGSRAVS